MCVGLKDPQTPVVEQVTVQSTPAFDESPVTLAVMEVVSLTPREDGGVGEMLTLTLLEEHPSSASARANKMQPPMQGTQNARLSAKRK